MAHETELKAFQNVVSHIINQGGVTLSPPQSSVYWEINKCKYRFIKTKSVCICICLHLYSFGKKSNTVADFLIFFIFIVEQKLCILHIDYISTGSGSEAVLFYNKK